MSTVNFSSKDVNNIVKFDGSNFPFWKFQIFLIFEQHNLLEIVQGQGLKPNLLMATDSNGAAISNEAAVKLWNQKDNAARVAIVAKIEQTWQRSLMNCRTAAEMW